MIPDYDEDLRRRWDAYVNESRANVYVSYEDPDAQAERQRRESIDTFRDALRIVAACAVASLLAMTVLLSWAAWGVRGLAGVAGFIALAWLAMELVTRWRMR
jgi:hypothetical protein